MDHHTLGVDDRRPVQVVRWALGILRCAKIHMLNLSDNFQGQRTESNFGRLPDSADAW